MIYNFLFYFLLFVVSYYFIGVIIAFVMRFLHFAEMIDIQDPNTTYLICLWPAVILYSIFSFFEFINKIIEKCAYRCSIKYLKYKKRNKK